MQTDIKRLTDLQALKRYVKITSHSGILINLHYIILIVNYPYEFIIYLRRYWPGEEYYKNCLEETVKSLDYLNTKLRHYLVNSAKALKR